MSKPKSKEFVTSTDDSDVSDQEVPKKKKPKVEEKKKKTEGEENVWELSRNRRITVSMFKGKQFIDIREFYEKDGKLLPGKKGISLNPDQWKELCKVTEEVNNALS